MRLPRPLHAQIRAARLGYLFPAAVIALWAALIPYLREALNLSAPQVAQLVFAFGAGSIAGMAAAGPLTKYTGSRFTCSAAAAGSVICIFMLALFPPFVMALACAAAFASLLHDGAAISAFVCSTTKSNTFLSICNTPFYSEIIIWYVVIISSYALR